ncbi:MAG: adhesin [Deltaproteobacteria bacterium]|nr:adhesin [Deltaproteobacteria bacterium]
MLEVTESTTRELNEFFKDKEKQPLRIFMKNVCGGPRPVLGMDELGDNDEVFERDGYTYVIEKTFYDQIKPVKVDFSSGSFQVLCSGIESNSCGSCSSGGSCCS